MIRSMSRGGTPTENPVIEALKGWIKEELCLDFDAVKRRMFLLFWILMSFSSTADAVPLLWATKAPFSSKLDGASLDSLFFCGYFLLTSSRAMHYPS